MTLHGKYTVSDSNSVLKFIDTELNAGRLSDNDAALLISYYDLQMINPTSNTIQNGKNVLTKLQNSVNSMFSRK